MNYIHESNRIYLEGDGSQPKALITFPKISDGLVDINHTYVDPSLRGQGIAGRLMEEAVTELRESGNKARISCSYAREWFGKHPECSDVLEDRG